MGKELSPVQKVLMHIVKKVPFDTPYTFTVPANDADSFLAQIRTELSRLRTKVRDRGYKPREFKLLTLNRELSEDGEFIALTLQKTTPAAEELLAGINLAINNIEELIAGGVVHDVPQRSVSRKT